MVGHAGWRSGRSMASPTMMMTTPRRTTVRPPSRVRQADCAVDPSAAVLPAFVIAWVIATADSSCMQVMNSGFVCAELQSIRGCPLQRRPGC